MIPSKQDKKLFDEYHKFCSRHQPATLYLEMVKRNRGHIKVLALDLEYTLTTEAEIGWPRPGLYNFLKTVKTMFDRVVIFTAVSEKVFRGVARNLVNQKEAPRFFEKLEVINWPRAGKKNLSYASEKPRQVLIVDDHKGYINPSELFQWIPIQAYQSVHYHYDFELNKVLGIIELIMLNKIKKERVFDYLEPHVNCLGSGIKKLWFSISDNVLKIQLEIDQKTDEKWSKEVWGKGVFERTQMKFNVYFWMPVEISLEDDSFEKDNSILIVNEYETFNGVLTRTPDGIYIDYPDLPGCKIFCPNDGTNFFDQMTLQTIEPSEEALSEWLKSATPQDIENRLSKQELKKRYPESSIVERSCRLPWKTLQNLALKTFDGNQKHARAWLTMPAYGLGGKIPLVYASTPGGMEAVTNLLIQIDDGIFI